MESKNYIKSPEYVPGLDLQRLIGQANYIVQTSGLKLFRKTKLAEKPVPAEKIEKDLAVLVFDEKTASLFGVKGRETERLQSFYACMFRPGFGPDLRVFDDGPESMGTVATMSELRLTVKKAQDPQQRKTTFQVKGVIEGFLGELEKYVLSQK